VATFTSSDRLDAHTVDHRLEARYRGIWNFTQFFADPRYDLIYKSRRYPPKHVVRLASRDVLGYPLEEFYGGAETNSFLSSRGFVVVAKNGSLLAVTPSEESDSDAFPEGKETYTKHRTRERDPRVVRLAKEKRLRETGDLACEVCGFSFGVCYGPHGAGFIEAHHKVPLSKLDGVRETRIEDLVLVCSNCHRVLHRIRPWLTVEQLEALIEQQREGDA
jgi:hypothetical protein